MRRPSLFLAYASCFAFVFIDQFGVLHDGRRLYPGALDALRAMKARGIKVVILSNSGRSGAANAERMAQLGLAQDLYDRFVTSGDVAKDTVRARSACLARRGLPLHDDSVVERARPCRFPGVDFDR